MDKKISKFRAVELGFIIEEFENKENFDISWNKYNVVDRLIERTIEKEFTVIRNIPLKIDNDKYNKNKYLEINFKVYDRRSDKFHDAFIKTYYENYYEESGEKIHGIYTRKFKIENVRYVKVESFNYYLKLEPVDYIL